MEKNLLSPCGLYCGVCAIRTAYLSGKPTFIAAIAKAYSVNPEKVKCEGCLSEAPFVYCAVCPIKSCARNKGLEGCYLCGDWPCDTVEQFPFDQARREIKRAIPIWRKLGTEKWIEHETTLYVCKSCGARLFRGARRCHECGADWVR